MFIEKFTNNSLNFLFYKFLLEHFINFCKETEQSTKSIINIGYYSKHSLTKKTRMKYPKSPASNVKKYISNVSLISKLLICWLIKSGAVRKNIENGPQKFTKNA